MTEIHIIAAMDPRAVPDERGPHVHAVGAAMTPHERTITDHMLDLQADLDRERDLRHAETQRADRERALRIAAETLAASRPEVDALLLSQVRVALGLPRVFMGEPGDAPVLDAARHIAAECVGLALEAFFARIAAWESDDAGGQLWAKVVELTHLLGVPGGDAVDVFDRARVLMNAESQRDVARASCARWERRVKDVESKLARVRAEVGA